MLINIIYIVIILILVFVILIAFKTVKKNISNDSGESAKTEIENNEKETNIKLNLVEEIKKIEKLHSDGILSDEEFELAKKKILK